MKIQKVTCLYDIDCVKSYLFILYIQVLQLLSLTYFRTTDICSPVQRSLPKLAGKLSVLYLNIPESFLCYWTSQSRTF